MRVKTMRVTAVALVLLPTFATAAPRAWVSATFGIDTGVCSRPTPCRTFTYAITKVDAGGEVNVLDSGGYGEMTITKSVTVNVASGVTAGIVAAVADGVTVNAGPGDEIILRGLTISATGSHAGIKATSFGVLHVESCSLNGSGPGAAGFPPGISATSGASAKVFIVDTIVRNFYDGIFVGGPVNATIERTRSVGNGEGLFAGINSRTTIRESVLSGNAQGMTVYNSFTGTTTAVTAANNTISNNTSHGIFVYADAGGTSEIVLSGNAIGDNGAGVFIDNLGGTADVTLAANMVHSNGIGVQISTSGGTTFARSRNDNTFLHNTGGDVTGGSLTTLLPK